MSRASPSDVSESGVLSWNRSLFRRSVQLRAGATGFMGSDDQRARLCAAAKTDLVASVFARQVHMPDVASLFVTGLSLRASPRRPATRLRVITTCVKGIFPQLGSG